MAKTVNINRFSNYARVAKTIKKNEGIYRCYAKKQWSYSIFTQYTGIITESIDIYCFSNTGIITESTDIYCFSNTGIITESIDIYCFVLLKQ
jgi:hypothetical protein